jgi:hypothetical protein
LIAEIDRFIDENGDRDGIAVAVSALSNAVSDRKKPAISLSSSMQRNGYMKP